MTARTTVDRPPRVAVIGAGETSRLLHLPVLARLRDEGRIVLVEICDILLERAEAAHASFGFARHSGDGRATVERPDIDAVYLFGSAQFHADYGLAALRSGKHLFVEKPVAPSHAEACALARAAEERALIAVGGHNRRFYRAFTEMRARSGKAGWRYGEAVFHKPEFGRPPPFGARTWLGANGIHALDALVFLMGGLPEQLFAAADGRREAPSRFSVLMRWADGAHGIFLCDNEAGARREGYAFHAGGETYRIGDAGLSIERDGTRDLLALPTLGDGFHAEHVAFLDAIASGETPAHSLATIAPSLFLAELIESGFQGKVPLPDAGKSKAKTSLEPWLVARPARLQQALATAPRCAPVALDHVRQSPDPRPDIRAAILGPGSPPLAPDVLAKLPNLAVVGVVGLSLARHEPEALLDRGITLVNASAAYAESVAEFALGLAILARRRALVSDRVMRRGGWGVILPPSGLRGAVLRTARNLRPFAAELELERVLLRGWRSTPALSRLSGEGTGQSRELRGAVVGLIGWGANARAFAARLLAAGAHVLVWSQHGAEADIRAAGARPASLGDVLAAEIVSLHRGLNSENRHFLGATELARLRPGAILINVARGALIEPEALIARLGKGDIFACLDTFEQEPPARDDRLRKLPNVFLTSHIAGGSEDMHRAAAREVADKIADFLDGWPVAAISRDLLATMS